MSKQRLQQATEEHASATQPTHYNVEGHDGGLKDGLTPNQQSAGPNPQSAQPPVETEGTEIKERSKVAGGVPAIVSTMRHALGEMGVRRSLKTLLSVNQKNGFDCPGCAWPEPDGERPHAEFCENGANHVASEATRKRITPEFFKEWSVAALSDKSDYWLEQQGRLTHPMLLKREA